MALFQKGNQWRFKPKQAPPKPEKPDVPTIALKRAILAPRFPKGLKEGQ